MADRKTGSRRTVIAVLVPVLVIAGLVVYFLFGGQDPEKQASRDAARYIEAVMKRDVESIFRYNAAVQKRKALIAKVSEEKESDIKDLYAEYRASFEATEPMSDLRGQWVEKWLFIPGMSYRITGAESFFDNENPSQPASDRVNVRVKVWAEYPERDSVPDLNGKVKKVGFFITMVQARNVSRILREDMKDGRWLFSSISADRDTIEYFNE